MGMFNHAIVYIPASGQDQEMWIDATAQYSQVGTLPDGDYGRWALVVGENGNPLKKIPELTAGQNVHREIASSNWPNMEWPPSPKPTN